MQIRWIKGYAGIWGFVLVQSVQAPCHLESFENGIEQYFIPHFSILISREWLRSLCQKPNVSSYNNRLQKIVISIPRTREDEKTRNGLCRLEPMVRMTVLKPFQLELK